MENEETVKKGIDLLTKEFQDTLTFVINSSNLPPVLVKYVLKDILKGIENIETEAISIQSKEYFEQIEKQNKEKNNEESKQKEVNNSEEANQKK